MGYIKASLEISLPLPLFVRPLEFVAGASLFHWGHSTLPFRFLLLPFVRRDLRDGKAVFFFTGKPAFLLPVVVQVFVVAVKNGLVDHFGRGYGFFQSGQRFSPRVIVVEEGMDDTVAREKRNSLLQIRYRVEYGGIKLRRQDTLYRESR